MKYKDITLKLRTAHMLRGERPCVVTIPKNEGKLYSGKKDEMYVMTLTKDNMLYFHGLSKWFKDYEPKMDFRLKLDGIKCYTKESKGKNVFIYTLSTKDGYYFPIRVIHGAKGTYETDVNLEAFERKLRGLGIKEEKIDE